MYFKRNVLLSVCLIPKTGRDIHRYCFKVNKNQEKSNRVEKPLELFKQPLVSKKSMYKCRGNS